MSDTPIFDNKTNPIVSKPLPWWAGYAKSIVAGIVGFAIAFLTAMLPYIQDGAPVSALGWVTATIAGLGSLGLVGGAVWAVPNRVKE